MTRFTIAGSEGRDPESLHSIQAIQPHGALITVRESDLEILQASTNARRMLGVDGPLPGRALSWLGADLVRRLRPHLSAPLNPVPLALRCRLGPAATEFDVVVHRPNGGLLVVEFEPAGPPLAFSGRVEEVLQRIISAPSVAALGDELVGVLKRLTGYDRVMLYRLDEAGHGEVCAEAREPTLPPYLGQCYPEACVPRMARQPGRRPRVRLLVDVDSVPVPLQPVQPLDAPLDMSLCTLRSVSPLHIQILKMMDVRATLVVSLVVGGRLWGLIACHHRSPRFVHYEIRALCELLAETVSTRIAALESFVQEQAELVVRRLEQGMIEAISRTGDWRSALVEDGEVLLSALGASGAVLFCDGELQTLGQVPEQGALLRIRAWLDRQPRAAVITTSSLMREDARFAALKETASGVLAVALSSGCGEYLVWFRPERVRTLIFGASPLLCADGAELSRVPTLACGPREVRGRALPWSSGQTATARLLGESVADVLQQFRSVRLLIAQAQLAEAQARVRISDQPMLITDPEGRLVLATASLERLFGEGRLGSLDALPALVLDPESVQVALNALREAYQPWHAEIQVRGVDGGETPVLVRGDPVFSAPGRVLGFMFLFTDLTGLKAAEDARQRFHAGIAARQRHAEAPSCGGHGERYRELFAAIIGNARVAALELADGVDLERVPAMVEGVEHSVSHTTTLLERLLWYAAQRQGAEEPGGGGEGVRRH
ncbi:GAF domain-containing protein [Marichromatium bheemlicum]|uniref:GAF domain-containing protein n=1 Tax=Marichromatium bheemlicum TaxID=365339 RepID=UPI001FE9FC37|nr:GAF domain-containing protein [Marichromatium bheemlicum]